MKVQPSRQRDGGELTMKSHYLVDTYHGPLVFTDCGDCWIVASPHRPPEIYDGKIPSDRLRHATPIAPDRAREIVGDTNGDHPDQLSIA
jgi:hypothetical protein